MWAQNIESIQSNHFSEMYFYQIQHQQIHHSLRVHPSQQFNLIIHKPEKVKFLIFQIKQTPLFSIHRRPYLYIESDINKDQKYTSVRNGHGKQTKKLNRYLKTKIKQFLDVQIKTHNLKHDEQFKRFLSGKQSFTNTKILFGISQHGEQAVKQDVSCDMLRILYQRYFRSINCLKSMMKAKNNFNQKLVVIKYLNIIHMIAIQPQKFNSWKSS